MIKPYIVCSAVRYLNGKKYEHQPINVSTGFVICGLRHHNCITLAYKLNRGRVLDTKGLLAVTIQGFLTSENIFVTRKEAGRIAYKAWQIRKETDCLMSEDLY